MRKTNKLKILYEDKYLIIVNKPSKLLTIGTLKEKNKTLYKELRDYLNKKNQKLFIVHRLDKDTEGLIIFAKTVKVKEELQKNWKKVIRKYYALVKGKLLASGSIKSYLLDDDYHMTHITNNKLKGKLAITNYKPIKSNNKYTLLDIDILTGRKNQIRVQLNSINHPIIGDIKYGNIKSSKLMLQAYYLEFLHPISNELIKIELDLDSIIEEQLID